MADDKTDADKPAESSLYDGYIRFKTRAAELRASDPTSTEAELCESAAECLRQGWLDNSVAIELERQKAHVSKWLDDWKSHREWYRENDRSVVAFSQSAQRTLIFVNAGAAVALLTFAGNLLTKGVSAEHFVPAIAWFAAGVGAGAVTSALTYLTQLWYGDEETEGRAKVLHKITIAIGASCLVTFVGGSVVTYKAFEKTKVPTIDAGAGDRTPRPPAVPPGQRNYPPPARPPANPPQPTIPSPSPPVSPPTK